MISAASRVCSSWRIFSTLNVSRSMSAIGSNRPDEAEKRQDESTADVNNPRRQRKQRPAQQLLKEMAAAAAPTTPKGQLQQSEKNAKLHEICDPTNILLLCHSNVSGSIKFEKARDILQPLASKHKSTSTLHKICEEMELEMANCEVCEKTINPPSGIIAHWLCKKHAWKVRLLGGNVSQAAVNYWLSVLQKADAAAIAAEAELQQAAAENDLMQSDPAAVAAEDEAPEEIKNTSDEAVLSDQPKKKTTLHETCHPTNIFQLCHPDAPDSISYSRARNMLRPEIKKFDNDALVKLGITNNSENLECEVCNKTLSMPSAILHLFSKSHYYKNKSLNANVSLAAVKYWRDVLKKEAAAARSQQQQAARSARSKKQEPQKTKQQSEKISPTETVAAAAAQPEQRKITKILHETCHPTNIFQLCRSDAPESIPFLSASKMLQSAYSKCDRAAWSNYREMSKAEIFDCEACKKKLKMPLAITHLFTSAHVNRVADIPEAHVSLAAVNHWLDVLQKEASAARPELQQLEPAAPAVLPKQPKTTLHKTCHPTNIFQLCRSDAPESIPFGSARDMLQSAFNKCDQDAWTKYRVMSEPEIFDCEACKKTLKMPHAITHFFSYGHVNIVAGIPDAHVSLAAVNHWLDVLHKVAAAAARPELQQPEPAAEAALPSAATEQVQPENLPAPPNILQLGTSSDEEKTIPWESAFNMLTPLLSKSSKYHLRNYCKTHISKVYYCEACNFSLEGYDTPYHFMSKEHAKKVFAADGLVSLAAVQAWQQHLLQVAAAAAQSEMAAGVAAAQAQSDPAAAAASVEAPEKIEKEETN